MLENEHIACPVCDNEISVKLIRSGKNITYLVSNECCHCKTSANKLENLLNKSNKRSYIKTEKSYLKVDPRG